MWDKIQLGGQALLAQTAFAFQKRRSSIAIDPQAIALPDSLLVRQTLEYIREVHQVPLQHHCLRSYVMGEMFGRHEKLRYDSEILAISALLHDLGLEERHCGLHPGIDCFAVEGAIAAGKFLAALENVPPEKIHTIQDAIAFHLNIRIPISAAEAYLLNKGTATDTIGFYRHDIAPASIQALMKIYPRYDLNTLLYEQLKHQASLRPHSRIAFLYQNGFGRRLKKTKFSGGSAASLSG
ncbi:MAG: HD domain-containing protein [Microscillaceae bacterium]